jgi:uncharacterized membrane protein/thiol-disulfide isomerase/thioredoxin
LSKLFLSVLGLSFWLFGFQTPQPVARVVLFYSPQCGHCHYVIQEILPPLHEKYGEQLEIIGIDVSQPQGSYFFQGVMQKFNLQSAGVPLLVIGDEYLMGSLDIPEQLPGLIEKYLSQGGVDYPDIPDLREAISSSQAAQESQISATPTLAVPLGEQAEMAPQTAPVEPTVSPVVGAPDEALTMGADGVLALGTGKKLSPWELVALDPVGNGLSIVILVGMLAVASVAALKFPILDTTSISAWQVWLVPALSLLGFFVAGYLAYVETTEVAAVCGPVGDCNTVQQSEYARLFGILPIGVLGLLGYIAIFAAWLVGRLNRPPLSWYADLLFLGMTAFGLAFSIYLTFLEPFVIGATCAWCLTSAIVMTALFWLSLKPARLAYEFVVKPKENPRSF